MSKKGQKNSTSTREIIIQKCRESPVITSITGFFWTLVTLFAIYLSLKCNNGFDFFSILGAVCCSPLFVVYKLALSQRECFKN